MRARLGFDVDERGFRKFEALVIERACVECGRRTTGRRCPKHQRLYDRARHNPGYDDPRYRSARRAIARSVVACGRCPQRATVIHHRDRNPRNNSPENHEPLCQDCHDAEHDKGGRSSL